MEMRFSFRADTQEMLSKADARVRVGQISVQRKSPFTVGNALRRAACKHSDKAKNHVSFGMVGRYSKHLDYGPLGGRKMRSSIISHVG